MARVYISGPMRHIPQFNFPAFAEAAARGRSLGWTVISPHEQDLEHGFDPTLLNVKDAFTHEEMRQFARRDANVLLNVLRAEEGDAIALLPGWEKSTGAKAELAIAQWVKLRVLDAQTFEPVA